MNLKWLTSYLTLRKQLISYDQKKKKLENITCGVHQK